MSFASRMTHQPHVFDAARAAETRADFSDLSAELRDLLANTASASPFLAGAMGAEADWLRGALSVAPEDALSAIMHSLSEMTARDIAAGLRQAKRRTALLVALADLSGVWGLDQVTGALTDLADAAVEQAFRATVDAERRRPDAYQPGPDGQITGLTVLAMGKMGARELNYSSDIDLICLFDQDTFDPAAYADIRAFFVKTTRKVVGLLQDRTAEGYVFRTDLRLRPDASVTPVCMAMEAAERYYESVGRTWERAAYIKARVCAGDIGAGQAFLKRLRPFIWRKHLDFAAIEDAHDMRMRIRSHRNLHGEIVLEGHDMKLGAGGIREIEFFTQTRQIIAGGRDPALRERRTVDGLARLAERDWVPGDVARELTDHYVAHRQTEHRLQMINDAQTHTLPTTPEEFQRLACLSGMDMQAMRSDILSRLQSVAELTEGFFAPTEAGADEPEMADPDIIARWPTYPALRSQRATEIFSRLKPDILSRLQRSARPQEALARFDEFLAGLPAGVQVFSLFEANPQIIDLIVDIVGTAPRLAQYLGRNASVFDAVIGGDFFAAWPGDVSLTADLAQRLEAEADYETRLDTARRWKKEWHFRIGVHQLRGLISAVEAGQQYAGLADAVLNAIWPVAIAEFASKHGAPPGKGACLVGMGSLGSHRMTAESDLDMIVIYDHDGVDASDGRRPLATRAYYARLTQSLLTALSAPMAEGRLYEVDMRLRPSGRQGPVATSLESFRSYQTTEAWTWEHLALTRARVVTGQADLMDAIEAIRTDVISADRDPKKTLADVADMRGRLAEAKRPDNEWDAKLGPGHMQDIELLAQTATLMRGSGERDPLEQMAEAAALNWISDAECAVLQDTYRLLWRLQSAARLLTGDAIDIEKIGQGGVAFLLRETRTETVDELRAALVEMTDKAAAIVSAALENKTGAG